MHICFITTGDIKSIATAKRALGLANPLTELGWQVSIIMENTEENKKRVALECNEKKVSVFYYSKCNVYNEIKVKNQIIKKISPDYIYVCAFVARNIVGLFNRNIKKLVEHSELVNSFRLGKRKILGYLLETFSIVYADRLLYASKYLQNYYTSYFLGKIFKKPGLYFPYAYTENICTYADSESIKQFKERLHIRDDEQVFVFLGSIAVNFGAYLMTDAIKEISAEGKYKVRLFLLGEGKVFKQLKKYIMNDPVLKNVIGLPGYIPEEEISLYFSIANAFILPMNDTIQDWARCPSKLYMYLPYKKPIITCKIGEPYEVLKNSGVYYDCGTATECSEMLLSAIKGGNIKYVKEALPSMINAIKSVCNGNSNFIDNSKAHTWKQRALELHNWLNKTSNI